LISPDLDVRGGYRKLAHPALAEQLRQYILDVERSVTAREVAIDIATACRVAAFGEVFADIALDSSQPLAIRERAAYGVLRIGDAQAKIKLKPLATGEVGDDPDDQLKGYSLKALWPAHMTA